MFFLKFFDIKYVFGYDFIELDSCVLRNLLVNVGIFSNVLVDINFKNK